MAALMGTCKLCGREAVLVRAHIVPDAFHRDLRSDAPVPPIQISNNPEAHTKRRPGGYYDEELLCSDCEKRTNPWDDYGATFLLQKSSADGRPITDTPGDVVAYQYDDVDHARLKLFAISLLWRASTTANGFFEKIDIGPNSPRANNQTRSEERSARATYCAGELSAIHQSSADFPTPPPGLALRFVLTWIVSGRAAAGEYATRSIPESVLSGADSIPRSSRRYCTKSLPHLPICAVRNFTEASACKLAVYRSPYAATACYTLAKSAS